jgi:hypothetical protein
LQETKNSVFGPFTTQAAAFQNAYMAIFFDQGENSLKESLGQMGMETQTMVERLSICSHKIKYI